MSSGQHDANREGEMIEDVWSAAYDLRLAIERAKIGHRGAAASDAQLLREMNNAFRSSGFRIIKDD